jgi:hypothetical protein
VFHLLASRYNERTEEEIDEAEKNNRKRISLFETVTRRFACAQESVDDPGWRPTSAVIQPSWQAVREGYRPEHHQQLRLVAIVPRQSVYAASSISRMKKPPAQPLWRRVSLSGGFWLGTIDPFDDCVRVAEGQPAQKSRISTVACLEVCSRTAKKTSGALSWDGETDGELLRLRRATCRYAHVRAALPWDEMSPNTTATRIAFVAPSLALLSR